MAVAGVNLRRIRISRAKAKAAAAGDVEAVRDALLDTLGLLDQAIKQEPDPRRMRVNGIKMTTGKKWNKRQGE